jgi:hypothetical protein
MMTIGLPAMVRVTDRATSWLTPIEKLKVPDPVRVAEVIATHDGTPEAFQVHDAPVETENDDLVPPAGTVTLAGVTVNEQVPLWVTE